jgi:hypothetical protein
MNHFCKNRFSGGNHAFRRSVARVASVDRLFALLVFGHIIRFNFQFDIQSCIQPGNETLRRCHAAGLRTDFGKGVHEGPADQDAPLRENGKA